MFDTEHFSSLNPAWAGCIRYHAEIDSTNEEARRLIMAGERGTRLILSDHQTAGRGRRGNVWEDQQGGSLLCSLLLPTPDLMPSLISLSAGLALHRALADLEIETSIKWPNDLIYQGKKCAGILVETMNSMSIVGIGVNLITTRGLPETASSVPLAREELLAGLLGHLECLLLDCSVPEEEIVAAIRTASFLTGKQVEFNLGEQSHRGEVCGIDREGIILIDLGEGAQAFPHATDLRV